jgi:hypothetical protein
MALDATLASALALAASLACAQPQFGNPSPTAGSKTSQQANAAADTAMYQPVEYANRNKKGPALIVIPGEVKSNNATFTQKFTANNIADYAELELSSANFQVLERSNLGSALREFELAYNLGDPDQARKFLRMGKLKSTKYVVKFDQRVGDRHALQDHQRRDDRAARAGLHRGEDGDRRDVAVGARRVELAEGRRGPRHDGAAARAEVGLGDRLEIQVGV